MSSTKRSKVRQEHVSDYYCTPQKEIRRFLDEFRKDLGELSEFERIALFTNARVLDPAAGGDEKHEMSYPAVLKASWIDIGELVTVDIREDSRAQIKRDFFSLPNLPSPRDADGLGTFDIVITNPPFAYAMDYIKKSLDLVKYDGLVIMLLRLNFFGSELRRDFLQQNPPLFCYVHSQRMSFGLNRHGKKGTDSIEYCHMIWQRSARNQFTKLRVI